MRFLLSRLLVFFHLNKTLDCRISLKMKNSTTDENKPHNMNKSNHFTKREQKQVHFSSHFKMHLMSQKL